jgi:Ricin-type beta-trefoil lectin domain/Concanavalin A-like lectin/glucanases superfamily/Fibronectin type III domain
VTAAWPTGDLFSPDVTLDGTNSDLAASGAAVNPAKDFSVSAWANPAALGGVVVSQDMTHAASFKIYPDTATGKWFFCMATSDTATATYNCASGGAVNLNVWTQLTATYQAATGTMSLYAADARLSTIGHTALSGTAGGDLRIGDYLSGTAHTGYFSGQVADVNVYGHALTTAQIAAINTGAVGATGPIASGIAGKCVDDTASSTVDGNKVQMYACNGDNAQTWTIGAGDTLRVFGKCLTNAGGLNVIGNPIQLSTCLAGDASQQWTPGANGSLVNPATGMCLDDPHSTTVNGTQLDLYTCNSTAAQEWRLPYTGLNYAGALKSGIAGKCVDDTGSSIANGNKIQLYTCNGDKAQDWVVSSDGTVRAFGACLDNTGGVAANGNPIQLWTCIPGEADQQWEPGPDGYLVNPGTNMCLDDPHSTTVDGTQLDLYVCNGTAAQVWTLPSTTVPGTVISVSAAAGTGKATVTWAAPAVAGGTPVTGYTVTASPGGATVTVTGTSATVTGLTSGTAYTFTVTAANAVGSGSASAPTTPVTAG